MKYKKTEAGQGGKKGHSNMSHWEGTEIIKSNLKKRRRQDGKNKIKKELEL